MTKPTVYLTDRFKDRVAASGMTHDAVARSMGVTKQYFSQVWNRQINPSTRFLVEAVRTGLADNFAEVAAPASTEEYRAERVDSGLSQSDNPV